MPTKLTSSLLSVTTPSLHCRQRRVHPRVSRRVRIVRCKSAPDEETQMSNDPEEGLLPGEDWTVPGGANDSLSSNTELGKAVRSAVDELEHLGKLEEEVLDEAYDLLEKLIKPSRNEQE